MSKPEHFATTPSTKTELEAELLEVERLLLLNEANENTIERTKKREQLQENEDWLLDAIELLLSQKTG